MKKKYLIIVLLNLILGCSSTETSGFLGGVLDVVEANPQILSGDFDSPIITPKHEEIENTKSILSEDNDLALGGVVDKTYYSNGQLQWEVFNNGDFQINKYYREDGSYEAELKFNTINNTTEQKLFNKKGELQTHNFYDSNLKLITQEEYNKLNASKNTKEKNIKQIKNDKTVTNKSSESMDEEVQRYLNNPSSPIVSREKLITYLNNLDGARIETNYHPNGMLRGKVYYKDGKFELYKNYDVNGKLVKILVYDIRVGAQYE